MKWFIILVLFLRQAILVKGQAVVNFSNGAPFVDAPVTVQRWNGPSGLAQGPEYAAQLFYSPNGTLDPDLFLPAGSPVSFSTGLDAGYFFGRLIAIPTQVDGTVITLQVRAFNTLQGNDYNTAKNSKSPILGQSNFIQYHFGGALPEGMKGLQSFSIIDAPIPEPSTLLSVVAALTLFCLGKPAKINCRLPR